MEQIQHQVNLDNNYKLGGGGEEVRKGKVEARETGAFMSMSHTDMPVNLQGSPKFATKMLILLDQNI